LWLKDDNAVAGAFEKIDQQIRGGYFWNDYSAESGSRVGLWTLSTAELHFPERHTSFH